MDWIYDDGIPKSIVSLLSLLKEDVVVDVSSPTLVKSMKAYI